jgi:hypothetical protein
MIQALFSPGFCRVRILVVLLNLARVRAQGPGSSASIQRCMHSLSTARTWRCRCSVSSFSGTSLKGNDVHRLVMETVKDKRTVMPCFMRPGLGRVQKAPVPRYPEKSYFFRIQSRKATAPRETSASPPGSGPCVGWVVTGTSVAETGVVWPAPTWAVTSQSDYPESVRRTT